MKINRSHILISSVLMLFNFFPLSADEPIYEGLLLAHSYLEDMAQAEPTTTSSNNHYVCGDITEDTASIVSYRKPDKKQIMLIGKIAFKNDINRNYYMKSFDIKKDLGDLLFMPNVLCPYTLKSDDAGGMYRVYNKKKFSFSMALRIRQYPNLFHCGEYFYLVIDRPKGTFVDMDHAELWFFGDEKTKMDIPLPNVAVSKDVTYAYIGTLVYDIQGDDFKIVGITINDDMEEASKAFDLIDKDHDPLTRCEVTFESMAENNNTDTEKK